MHGLRTADAAINTSKHCDRRDYNKINLIKTINCGCHSHKNLQSCLWLKVLLHIPNALLLGLGTFKAAHESDALNLAPLTG